MAYIRNERRGIKSHKFDCSQLTLCKAKICNLETLIRRVPRNSLVISVDLHTASHTSSTRLSEPPATSHSRHNSAVSSSNRARSNYRPIYTHIIISNLSMQMRKQNQQKKVCLRDLRCPLLALITRLEHCATDVGTGPLGPGFGTLHCSVSGTPGALNRSWNTHCL